MFLVTYILQVVAISNDYSLFGSTLGLLLCKVYAWHLWFKILFSRVPHPYSSATSLLSVIPPHIQGPYILGSPNPLPWLLTPALWSPICPPWSCTPHLASQIPTPNPMPRYPIPLWMSWTPPAGLSTPLPWFPTSPYHLWVWCIVLRGSPTFWICFYLPPLFINVLINQSIFPSHDHKIIKSDIYKMKYAANTPKDDIVCSRYPEYIFFNLIYGQH